jgi:hypothetical protein
MKKKSIRQRLRDWLTADDMSCESIAIDRYNTVSIHSNTIDGDKGIRFQVYKANGGTIVETTFYDRHKDRSYNGLYVITDDKDLGKEIGKIITMETIKQ